MAESVASRLSAAAAGEQLVGAAGVGVARHRHGPLVGHRPFVDAGRHLQGRHAQLGLAGHEGAHHRRGAAPVGHERRVHDERGQGVEDRRRHDAAVGAGDEDVGREGEQGGERRGVAPRSSGWSTGRPRPRAASLSGEGCGAPWRPRGRSGVVRQTTTSWGERRRARDSTSTANRAVPAQAIRKRSSRRLEPRAGGSAAVSRSRSSRRARARSLAGGAFDDEHAVEVVVLVLDHARLEALGLVLETPAAGPSRPRTRTATGRSTGIVTPGTLRQPSSASSVSSRDSTRSWG